MTKTPLGDASDPLRRIAASTAHDRGAVATETIEFFLDDSAWQLEAIGRAVHDVDADGDLYEHEDVMAYLERRLVAGPTTPRPRSSRDA